MPRFSKRRTKRKPKARKRIDKLQNKRITRLEESIEKKFAIHPVRTVTLSSELATNTAQIYVVLPDLGGTGTESSGDPLIGNQISLKRVHTRFSLLAPNLSDENRLQSDFACRVLFFWNVCPRSWSTSADPPTSTQVAPSWPQLLNNVVLDGPASGTSMQNMSTCQQQITKSNKSPIVILSDKVYTFNGSGNSKRGITVDFHKTYKSMKLCYNNTNDAVGTQPVNRQLYMAVICDQVTNSAEAPNTTTMSYCTTMHYTDA